jgi:hypothetical protein
VTDFHATNLILEGSFIVFMLHHSLLSHLTERSPYQGLRG